MWISWSQLHFRASVVYDRSLMPQHFQVHLEDRLQTWTSLIVRFSLLGNNFRPFHLHPDLKHVQQRRLNNNEEQRFMGLVNVHKRIMSKLTCHSLHIIHFHLFSVNHKKFCNWPHNLSYAFGAVRWVTINVLLFHVPNWIEKVPT